MLLSAEQYIEISDQPDGRVELVDGIIACNPPESPRHGQICADVGYLLQQFVRCHGLGHVVGNNAGMITRRKPDTVRGPDIAFYSLERVP